MRATNLSPHSVANFDATVVAPSNLLNGMLNLNAPPERESSQGKYKSYYLRHFSRERGDSANNSRFRGINNLAPPTDTSTSSFLPFQSPQKDYLLEKEQLRKQAELEEQARL